MSFGNPLGTLGFDGERATFVMASVRLSGLLLDLDDIPQSPCSGPASDGGGGRGTHVARLSFKTSRVGVYKCLSLIVGFAVTVAIWPREVVASACRNFILRAVATFWAMSLVRIYPGRASE